MFISQSVFNEKRVIFQNCSILCILCFLLLTFWYQSQVKGPDKIKATIFEVFAVAEKMTTEGNFVQPSIPRFGGHYDHWSMLMENFLRSQELWGGGGGGASGDWV